MPADITEAIAHYENKLGRFLMPMEFEKLKLIVDDYSLSDITKAIDKTADKRPRSPFRYMEAILVGEKNNGTHKEPVTTDEQREAGLHKTLS